MGGAPIRFAGGSAKCGAGGGRWTVDDGRNAHADVIEVVIEDVIVNERKGRLFLASLGSFFNA